MKRLAVVGSAALAVVALSVPAGAQAQEVGPCEPEVQPNGFVFCSDPLDLGFSLGPDEILSVNVADSFPVVVPIEICDVVEIIVGPSGASFLPGCDPFAPPPE